MFALSKILGFIIQPSNFFVLLFIFVFLIGLKNKVVAWRAFGASLLLFTLASFSPLAVWLATILENSYPEIRELKEKPQAIIVLGGAVMPHYSQNRLNVQLSDAAERMTEGLRLAKLYPTSKLIFSGGAGIIKNEGQPTEAKFAEQFYLEQGISKEQLILENKSRNTKENALFTKDLVAGLSNIVLVTSATHLPRAVRYYEKAGVKVIPYPVDYNTRNDFNDKWTVLINNMRLLDRVMHEFYGLTIQYFE